MKLNFTKSPDGLLPAIIQDSRTNKVLMLGYMNQESFDKTVELNRVTFFSRSKNRLWTKGEESGNFLNVDQLLEDCDKDTILVKVTPTGPVCHKGTDTCFNETNELAFIDQLENLIRERKDEPREGSYVSDLFSKGINKIAQKVGEEAVELIIEAKDENEELFLGEAADLLFHYMILLNAKGYKLEDVSEVLKSRSR